MSTENLTEIKRLEYIDMIKKVRQNNKENIEINKILNLFEKAINSRKYGINWEEHIEKADYEVQNGIPVFYNNEEKNIIKNKNEKVNFLLEGDNLHVLSL